MIPRKYAKVILCTSKAKILQDFQKAKTRKRKQVFNIYMCCGTGFKFSLHVTKQKIVVTVNTEMATSLNN